MGKPWYLLEIHPMPIGDACLEFLGRAVATAAIVGLVWLPFWLFQQEVVGISLIRTCIYGALPIVLFGAATGKNRREKLCFGAVGALVGVLMAPGLVGFAIGIAASGG